MYIIYLTQILLCVTSVMYYYWFEHCLVRLFYWTFATLKYFLNLSFRANTVSFRFHFMVLT